MIPMDAVLIEQVTINLLENAIVHSGSILPIDFIVEDHPEHVSFIVRDYGKGLSEENYRICSRRVPTTIPGARIPAKAWVSVCPSARPSSPPITER